MKSAPAPFKMSCSANVDYVTAGETYTVTMEPGRAVRFHFRNDRTGGATTLAGWQVGQAVKSGALEYVSTAAERRAANFGEAA